MGGILGGWRVSGRRTRAGRRYARPGGRRGARGAGATVPGLGGVRRWRAPSGYLRVDARGGWGVSRRARVGARDSDQGGRGASGLGRTFTLLAPRGVRGPQERALREPAAEKPTHLGLVPPQRGGGRLHGGAACSELGRHPRKIDVSALARRASALRARRRKPRRFSRHRHGLGRRARRERAGEGALGRWVTPRRILSSCAAKAPRSSASRSPSSTASIASSRGTQRLGASLGASPPVAPRPRPPPRPRADPLPLGYPPPQR